MIKFNVGDIVEWNEKEVAKTGLSHIKGIIKEDNGGLHIVVREFEDDGTQFGKPGLSYSLDDKRIEAIMKWQA